MINKEQMNIVIVGHVDHGKSTVIGRLLADTCSLPNGKLEQVKEMCQRNSKPFEYAFLLDALKDEQSQGITIDTARSFFKTQKRDYIIIDAPGHIEFLKNMITGAARAEAALLVIDAHEGIKENSKRHGHMVAMLGVKQVCVLVNKMDLANYDESVFNDIKKTYTDFLSQINVVPAGFIPISARNGENVASRSDKMPWYGGFSVLEQLDAFYHEKDLAEKPFRMPVQDIYKFTQNNDERRIVAGTVSSGKIRVGDQVTFLPSGKSSTVATIEAFSAPVKTVATTGEATGFTLQTQIYIKPGEIMVKNGEQHPLVSGRFKTNIFWVGRTPMTIGKIYKLKLATASTTVRLVKIHETIDASDLSVMESKKQLDRHDVAECILETTRPIAFDLSSDNEGTGRFVIVDNYEIAGGGIVLANADEVDREELDGDDSLPSDFLPVSLNIRGKQILIVGGGAVALQKIESLRRFTGNISVVAEKVSEEVRATGLKIAEKNYESSDLSGIFLVYACTNSASVNAQIRDDARSRGILVNVVDDPENCDIVSPAIYKKGSMTVAVSSDGKNVKRSVSWRDKIEAFLEQ